MSTIQVLILEDREVVRYGLKAIIENIPNCRLVRNYSDISSLNHHLEKSSVQILLLDDTLPGIDTANLVRRLKHQHPTLRIIVVGSISTPSHIQAHFDAKADGFIYKGEELGDMLAQAISCVIKGEIFMSPRASKSVLSYNKSNKPVELSERLKDVLALLAKDFTVKEIAQALGITDKAVYSARDRLKEMLGAENTAGILSKAITLKLIEPDDSRQDIG